MRWMLAMVMQSQQAAAVAGKLAPTISARAWCIILYCWCHKHFDGNESDHMSLLFIVQFVSNATSDDLIPMS